MNFEHYKAHCIQWVTQGIECILNKTTIYNPELLSAMRYSVLGPGKRIRAILVHAACRLNDSNEELALPAACAVELLHSYSLIHDDLPAMDNDDWRRGKPSCHKTFGEALAILAGDALHTLSIEVLTTSLLEDALKLNQIKILTEAAGCQGMIRGQVMDMMQPQNLSSIEALTYLKTQHTAKTGALICASLSLGAYARRQDSQAPNPLALDRYGQALGLAFQIQDDILDVCIQTEQLGKPQGSDHQKNKITYVTLLGLAGAQEKLKQTLMEARSELDCFGKKADVLREITHYIEQRTF